LTFEQAWVDELAKALPELPDEKKLALHAGRALRLRRRSLVGEKNRGLFRTMGGKGDA